MLNPERDINLTHKYAPGALNNKIGDIVIIAKGDVRIIIELKLSEAPMNYKHVGQAMTTRLSWLWTITNIKFLLSFHI